MRNISFALTTKQFLDGTKTVTRRLGWEKLQPGTSLMGVRKAMGLKPGEKIDCLGQLLVTSVRREPLNAITDDDCAREGFPELTASGFVQMFCKHMKCDQDVMVTRIEFKKITTRIYLNEKESA